MSKIYFDTTPIIYFLDDEKPFSDKVALFIANHQEEDDFSFQIVEPNRFITQQAAKIRAKYKGIKGMDSIHLATSMYFNCDLFLTNDAQLKQVSEVNVVLVDDL